MGNFKIGTEVHFGDDSLKRLNDFKDEKVFVVTDPFMVKSGTINRVTDELKKVNSRYMVYSDIVPDPSTDIVAKGVEAMMQFDADVIVALGGGSAIDSAKAIKYFSQR